MGKLIYNKGFADAIIKPTLAPTINFIEKDGFSITVTFTNNSGSEATISYGLTSPPNEGTVLLDSEATSNEITFSELDAETPYTIFASANGTPNNLIESNIVSIQVTTDNPFVVFTDTSGSPGATFPINDLDGNIMANLDKGIAYYGTVSHTDLFTGDELASEIGLTAGFSTNNQSIWHKYYWNNGIHFFRKSARGDTTYNSIWSRGAVFGTGTNTSRKGYTPTVFQSNNSLSSINQDAEVTKNGITYAVRLFETASVEPASFSSGSTDFYGSEFALILMNLHAATNSGSYSTSPTDGVSYNNWETDFISNNDFVGWKTNLNDAVFSVGNGVSGRGKWTQETLLGSLDKRVRMGDFSSNNLAQFRFVNSNSGDGHAGWFPVLTVKAPGFTYE